MDGSWISRLAVRVFAPAGLGLALGGGIFLLWHVVQEDPRKSVSRAPEQGSSLRQPVPPVVTDQDDPYERQSLFFKERAYPFKRIPPGARLAALARTEEIRRETRRRGGAAGQWQNLGPFGSSTDAFVGWKSTSGRVRSLAADPADSNVLYVGGAQGGVWKSTDGGTNFTPLTDFQPSLAIGSIAVAPSDPDIVYVGTGERADGADCYFGAGLLRSPDGGATWTQRGVAEFAKAGVSRILVDPGAPSVLLVATGLTGYRPDGAAIPPLGVYRSTDGGLNWTMTLAASGGVYDLARHPGDSSLVYAGVANGASEIGFYRSMDGGQNWTGPMGTGLPNFTDDSGVNFRLAAASVAGTLYLSHGDDVAHRGVYKSTDSGDNWSELTTAPDICEGQCWYCHYIEVHPLDPNQVFLGGIGWARSMDGGATWSQDFPGYLDPKLPWYESAVHVDHQAMAFDPVNPEVFYLGSDGGAWKTPDNGATWQDLNSNGLSLTQFYHVALHPTSKGYMLAGAQDNSPQQFNGARLWHAISTGDGSYSAINPQDPNIQFVSTQYFSIQRSFNHGGTWTELDTGVAEEDTSFIAPFLLDPVDPSKVWTGAKSLVLGSNNGDSWTSVGSWASGSTAVTLAVSAGQPQTVYVGTTSGLEVSTNTGQNFTNRSAGLPDRTIKEIAVEPENGQNAYVSFSGFGTGHVFRTTNSGQDWSDISGNLPDIPVNSIALDASTDPTTLWVGTDTGIFRSEDLGVTWLDQSAGLPNVAVFKLAYNPANQQLAAATHGRGVWEWKPTGSTAVSGGSTIWLFLAILGAGLWMPLRVRRRQRDF